MRFRLKGSASKSVRKVKPMILTVLVRG
jgi:hypothetical protein